MALLVSNIFDLNAVRPTLTVAGSFAAFTMSLIKVVKAASVPLAPISPIATGSHFLPLRQTRVVCCLTN